MKYRVKNCISINKQAKINDNGEKIIIILTSLLVNS